MRNKPISMSTEKYTTIPEYFYKIHKFVTLTPNVMLVNMNAFIITSTRKLKFMTTDQFPCWTAVYTSKSLNKLIKLYRRGGFIIHVILMGVEFEKVADMF